MEVMDLTHLWDKVMEVVKVAGLLVLSFLFLFTLGAGSEHLYHRFTGEPHQVQSCFINDRECQSKTIYKTVTKCEHVYRASPLMLITGPPCKMTTAGIEKVSIVADPLNHVRAPFTDVSYSTEHFNPGLEEPWDLEFLPDGSALITEKGGEIVYWKGGETVTVGEVNTLSTQLTGLMGLAVHPDFEDNRYVYLQYTVGWDEKKNSKSAAPFNIFLDNRISRFKFVGGVLRNETVLLEDVPGSRWRAGGRLEFGPDGKLYATTGDANNLSTSQDPDTLNGKILRINPDGSVPRDNPFDGSYIYSRGHRNPQGMAWHPSTGEMFETEHGPWRRDELNQVEPGNNYGWGALKCTSVNDESVDLQRPAEPPAHCFRNWTMAPSGITFVDDRDSPLYGDLLIAGLRGKHVHHFVFEGGEVVENEIFYYRKGLEGPTRRMRDVEYFNGSVWVIGETRGVARLSLEG